jgi:hypothetical protein
MTQDEIDYSKLAEQIDAEQIVKELDTGRIGDSDRFMLSRRQLAVIAGSGLGAGALASLGIEEVEAQTATGTIGTASQPVDIEAAKITFPNLSDKYEIQKDGTDGQGTINFKTQ